MKHGSVRSASKAIGIETGAGYRLSRNPIVREMFIEARREMFRIGVAQAMGLISKAWRTLEAVMDNEDASPGARTQAAAEVIRLSRDHLQTDDLELRIRAIEEAEGRETNQSQPGIEAKSEPKPEPEAKP
ncbi:MAG: hypothetical protein KF805_12540 [Phycisphaeraceae bacterium]|nr:hypothetical protein [Phycisphaeraceae bacterium]